MKKNVASQTIGAQLVDATSGAAFTGSASVFVQGDTGSQASGGGSAPTHRGNGYHTYGPTQAETNFDRVAFTFTGAGAIPVTVQAFTNFPQSADAPTAAAIATAFLAAVVEGSHTVQGYLRGFAAALFGKLSGVDVNLPVFRDPGDSKNRVSATVTATGRTIVTLDFS
jgi:hypothetical protein